MICKKCGADLPTQAAFCPNCGAQVDSSPGAVHRPPASGPVQSGVAQGTSRDVPEEDLWTGSYSPKAMSGPFAIAVVLIIAGMIGASFAGPPGWVAIAIAAVLVLGYLTLSLLYQMVSIHYRLTTHRLVVQRGILSRTDDRILLVDIDDISVQQGLFERMCNVGTISLRTSDETTRQKSPDPNAADKGILIMSGIENPQQTADAIDEARRSERSRRGVYMMNA